MGFDLYFEVINGNLSGQSPNKLRVISDELRATSDKLLRCSTLQPERLRIHADKSAFVRLQPCRPRIHSHR